MVGAIIGLLPLVIAEIVFPPAFDMTAYKDRVDYEFRDPIYALMFAFKNKPTSEVISALAKAGENDDSDLPNEADEPELPDPYTSRPSDW